MPQGGPAGSRYAEKEEKTAGDYKHHNSGVGSYLAFGIFRCEFSFFYGG